MTSPASTIAFAAWPSAIFRWKKRRDPSSCSREKLCRLCSTSSLGFLPLQPMTYDHLGHEAVRTTRQASAGAQLYVNPQDAKINHAKQSMLLCIRWRETADRTEIAVVLSADPNVVAERV